SSFVVSALPDVDVFQSLHDIPLKGGFFSARQPECRIRSIYHHLKEEAGHSKTRLSSDHEKWTQLSNGFAESMSLVHRATLSDTLKPDGSSVHRREEFLDFGPKLERDMPAGAHQLRVCRSVRFHIV